MYHSVTTVGGLLQVGTVHSTTAPHGLLQVGPYILSLFHVGVQVGSILSIFVARGLFQVETI